MKKDFLKRSSMGKDSCNPATKQIFAEINRLIESKTCVAGESLSEPLKESLKNFRDQKSRRVMENKFGDINLDNPMKARHNIIKTKRVFFRTFSLGYSWIAKNKLANKGICKSKIK
tara:strand:+ start:665 stop:1012 length:348 start_codon:yes stop_codon:yes gene_type:complete